MRRSFALSPAEWDFLQVMWKMSGKTSLSPFSTNATVCGTRSDSRHGLSPWRDAKRGSLCSGSDGGGHVEISPDTPDLMESVTETEEDALPEGALLALEEQHLVRTALAQMPNRCRLMLSLLYITDPPAVYTAVAARLQMPVGSVGPQRARCLEKLKKKLGEMGY